METLGGFSTLQGCAAEQHQRPSAHRQRNRELSHAQDVTPVCLCDGVAYYGVQEYRQRGFILGRASPTFKWNFGADASGTLGFRWGVQVYSRG